MKKLLCFTLSALLAAALAVPAFADDTTTPANKTLDSTTSSGTTDVQFSVQPTYTITIPAKVELAKKDTNGAVTYENDLTVTASDVRLNEKEELKVSLQSDYKLSVNSTVLTYELPYTVTVKTTSSDAGKEVNADNAQVATFVTDNADQTVTLHFAANNPKYAGDYSDTVTFTLAVVDATQTGNGGNA